MRVNYALAGRIFLVAVIENIYQGLRWGMVKVSLSFIDVTTEWSLNVLSDWARCAKSIREYAILLWVNQQGIIRILYNVFCRCKHIDFVGLHIQVTTHDTNLWEQETLHRLLLGLVVVHQLDCLSLSVCLCTPVLYLPVIVFI